jgi:hypothetical protein
MLERHLLIQYDWVSGLSIVLNPATPLCILVARFAAIFLDPFIAIPKSDSLAFYCIQPSLSTID